jgi:hypothetical protein
MDEALARITRDARRRKQICAVSTRRESPHDSEKVFQTTPITSQVDGLLAGHRPHFRDPSGNDSRLYCSADFFGSLTDYEILGCLQANAHRALIGSA